MKRLRFTSRAWPRNLEWGAVLAVLEFLVLDSLVVGIIVVMLGTARLVTPEGDRVRGLARAALIFASSLALVLFANRREGEILSRPVIPVLFLAVIVGVVALNRRQTRERLALTGLELTGLIGPLVLGSVVLYSYVRASGSIAWAMSGDARNHVIKVRDTIEAGGLSIPGYPGLGNAIAGLAGGWKFDLSAEDAGQLGSEVAAIAVTIVLLLWMMSLFAASLVTPKASVRDIQVFAGVGTLSLLPLSQFWLHTLLYEGFLPSGLAVAAVLAAALEVGRTEGSRGWRVSSCVMAGLILGFTYPPLISIAAGLLVFAILDPSVDTLPDRWFRTLVVGFAAFLAIGGTFLLRLSSAQSYTAKSMELDGRITPVDGRALWLLTAISLVGLFGSSALSRRLWSVAVCVGVSAIVTDRFLDRILTAEYYLNKTRWMSTFVMFVLVLASTTSVLVDRKSILRRAIAGCIVLGVIAMSSIGLIQSFPPQLALRSLATRWSLPTTEQARLIVETNGHEPRSVFWQVSPDSLTTRVMDIWMTAGIEGTAVNVSWGYAADVMSIEEVCSFAAANAPMTVWVPTYYDADLFDEACDLGGVSIRVIDE